ncbi:metal transporter CNNM4-like [Anneissia japonica]|nr:metal transporter CNNM4-like [Anneissia japonica]
MEQDIICDIRLEHKDDNIYLYTRGKPADFFVLILQGKVEVSIGKENLIFEQGPFAYFGHLALCQPASMVTTTTKGSTQSIVSTTSNVTVHYLPDFSVRIASDVQFLRVTRAQYQAARAATKMELDKKEGSENVADEIFKKEWKKVSECEVYNSTNSLKTPEYDRKQICDPSSKENVV